MEVGPIRLADIVIVVTLIGGLWALLRKINDIVSTIQNLRHDWEGEPGRPGVEARPGVMERLRTDEQVLGRIEQRQIEFGDAFDAHVQHHENSTGTTPPEDDNGR